MCPLSRNEFEMKSEVELDLRASKVRVWLLDFMTTNRENAYTISELTDLCPKDRMKKDVQNPESSVNSAMTKLISNGLVKRKGSYYIRTNGKRKYTRHADVKPEKKNGKNKEKDAK